MSRAFVKEPEGDQADTALPERPQSAHPNYITLRGLEHLRSRVESLRARGHDLELAGNDLSAKNELAALRSELRYFERRVHAAIPIDTAAQGGDEIRFGATVEVQDDRGERHAFTIVGEDEADPDSGLISWVSPLGRALLNRRAGDAVRWQRPAGDLELEIISLRYPRPD